MLDMPLPEMPAPRDRDRDAKAAAIGAASPLRPAQGGLLSDLDGLALFDHGHAPQLF